jgi:hypothetical protein
VCQCNCDKHTIVNVHAYRLVRSIKTHCGCERKYILRENKPFPEEYVGKKKICNICNKEKDYYDFHYTLKRDEEDQEYYYFYTQCIECSIRKIQNKRIENPQDIVDYNHDRYLRKKEEYLPLYVTYRNVNKEKYKEWSREWRRNNPERCSYLSSLHRKHDVSSTEEQAMLKAFNYSCAYCGMTLKEHKNKFNEKLHNEHVDNEGYNDLRNDIPACKSCNCSKHEYNMEEWYEKQSFYSREKYDKIIWWITIGYQDYIEDKPPYIITRSRLEFDDGTYGYQHELWSVDEKRNMVECIDIKRKKKDLDLTLI